MANGGDGTVSVLDVHSGTILHTIHVRPEPVAALVDERAGHALVISLGGGRKEKEPERHKEKTSTTKSVTRQEYLAHST